MKSWDESDNQSVKQSLTATKLDNFYFLLTFLIGDNGTDLNPDQIQLPHYLLTTYNWQKWKRVFLTCPCHEIDKDEAVGLKSCKYTLKIPIYVDMWNLGQFRENLIFCQ